MRVILLALIIASVAAAPVRGKVSSIADYAISGENRSFAYDANGRLLTASGPWGSGSYKYDALGNLREKKLGSRTVAIAYDAAKNRVSSVTDTGNPARAFAYDARGNTVNDGRYQFVYDFANQPVSATGSGETQSYEYDANLRRVKHVRSDGAVSYDFYSRVTGTPIFREGLTTGQKWDFVDIGPMSAWFMNGAIQSYHHRDHQGSRVASTNATGAVTNRYSLTPFGELFSGANTNAPLYTGHFRDADTGLNYMQRRFQDPIIGRFLSTDPIGYEDQLNLYAYVANDPVNKVDPTGEYADLAIEAVSISLGAASLADNLGSGNLGGAAIDAVGIAVDAAAAAVPGLPGAAGIGIKAAREGGQKLSQRAATREAKRQAGIPTSQQAKSQTSATAKDGTKVGRQQTHETPKPGGGTQEKSVQVSRDQVGSHAGQPQIEAGNIKPGGQADRAGRPRIDNPTKVRVDFDPGR